MGRFLDIIKSCLGRAPPPQPPRRREYDDFKYFTTDFSANPASRWAVAVFQAILHSANTPDANILINPYLAEIILTRLLNDTLKFKLLDEFHTSKGDCSDIFVIKDGETATTSGALECVNATFSDESYGSASRPERTIRHSVNCGLEGEPVDQSPSEGSATVNRSTGERVDEKSAMSLAQIMQETRRIATNIVDFSCRWEFEFEQTTSGTFYCPNNVEKTVEFLKSTVGMCRQFNRHYGSSGFRADPQMIMFYAEKGKFSIMLLLPATDNDHISSLEKELTIEKLLEVRRKSREGLAYVIVPKLRINIGGGFAAGNKNTLSTTNSAEKFEEDRPPECVGQFRQGVVLNLDENGINATQAPYRDLHYTLLLYEPEFVANRPFLMIIWDEMANVPVFIGRITDPTGAAIQISSPYCDSPPQSCVQNQ
ncbi:serine proteinase inhibitor A3K-like [Paramacrobiotus metropolitanus]|uniref:serine proteinase inhibitor A3K-like n=1 Tax=Paramacrobiotus metropolitanus TaxID=2943436 RepID=UPI0024458A72|nr:serine proteinase inhibitor A3K-like [Paramacrobiotus metropolitanus]